MKEPKMTAERAQKVIDTFEPKLEKALENGLNASGEVLQFIQSYVDAQKFIAQERQKAQDIAIFMRSPLVNAVITGFARGVGHTYSAIFGVASNEKALLVVAYENEKRGLELTSKKIISLNDLAQRNYYLAAPLVFDNHALLVAFDQIRQSLTLQ